MAMVPVNIDSSTLATTSVLSGAITFVFCKVAMETNAGVAAGVALAVGTLLYLTGIVPIGLLLVVGIGMVVVIAKKLTSSIDAESNPSESPAAQHPNSPSSAKLQPSQARAASSLTVESVLAPHKSVKDALDQIQEEITKGTQVPVLLGRVFPSIPHAHTHQINTFYVKLRAEGNSKVGALTHALDEYVKALGRGT